MVLFQRGMNGKPVVAAIAHSGVCDAFWSSDRFQLITGQRDLLFVLRSIERTLPCNGRYGGRSRQDDVSLQQALRQNPVSHK